MQSSDYPNHIAAGCLVLQKADTNFPQEVWSLLKPLQWHHFGPFADHNERGRREVQISNGGLSSELRFLAPDIQHSLTSASGCLAPYVALLHGGWIRMSFAISLDDASQAIVRVYILPDDVDNCRVPRWDASLRKARLSLLGKLDYSRSTWQGKVSSRRCISPPPFASSLIARDSPLNQDQSLLQMFNNIPSPNPNPDEIQGPEARDAAYRLMDSDVPGLNTVLYVYQRRSAALMLQRENPGQHILDPRLLRVVDQLEVVWYYDAVTGTSLREPKYYDRPCGGILAEEMGAGKTLICLALILATRHIPSSIPELYRTNDPVVRPRVGSLADMAAACATRHSVPWRTVFGSLDPNGVDYPRCLDAIRSNPGVYELPPPTRRRERRQPDIPLPSKKIYLSHCSLVIVPPNLVQQWKQEIAKHTLGLRVLIADKKERLPPATDLVECDIILFSSTQFERIWKDPDGGDVDILAQIHFKRCIVDEGHKLGNSTMHKRSDIHLFIDHLQITAKWAVTGTPSKGLFGVDDSPSLQGDRRPNQSSRRQAETSLELERKDLKRIGAIAAFYLKMRPWANLPTDVGDSQADWLTYVMQPQHSPRSAGRADCLKSTLESLIIRHRLSELSHLLPGVDERIVYLDGSYQDTLVLNLFSMMIIANAVQSERKDQDYLFHPRQRKALIELVTNLRRSSFFGGSFFSPADICKTVEMAEEFLREGKIPISDKDADLLRDAIAAGRLAEKNHIKECSNLFHEIPLYVQCFPWGAGQPWSLDLKDGDPVCTDSRMILELQRFLQPLVDAPESLQIIFETGRLAERGREARLKGIEDQDSRVESASQRNQAGRLAGNTQLGQESGSPSKRRSVIMGKGPSKKEEMPIAAGHGESGIAEPLARTQLVSTASAKLSYLVDQILMHQEHEQIIVFYEDDNVAYYLAGVLEILQVQHLIYAKGLTPERRAQYVATFNFNPKFRVMLMDVTQAAFGLDMKSASRIYFINPVLNPQVEAQAIGRARRISQKKPVSVETLVLRGSVEEVIVKRRGEMTQAEQWKCRSILDDKPIYEWILNAKILPLPGGGRDLAGPDQMAKLQTPQFIFGRGFGRGVSHPDQDLVTVDAERGRKENGVLAAAAEASRKKRPAEYSRSNTPTFDEASPPKRRPRVRFAYEEDDGREFAGPRPATMS